MKNNISFKNIFKLLSMAFALLVVSFFGKAASTGVSFSLKDILEPYQANADEPGEGSDFGSFGMDGCADLGEQNWRTLGNVASKSARGHLSHLCHRHVSLGSARVSLARLN